MFDGLLHAWSDVVRSITQISLIDVIDILIMAVVLYVLLRFAKDSRAMQVAKGIGLVLVLTAVTELLGFTTITWLLNYVISAGAIIVVIVFQPEIRRALEEIGQGKYFKRAGAMLQPDAARQDNAWAGEELIRALMNLAKSKTGALVVVERGQALTDIAETGTRLDAYISQPLLENIFVNGSPLHDGAVILRGDRIAAAGCFLPLSSSELDRNLGTRHRAALGMSETSSAYVFVVSEETGAISVANGSHLQHNIDVRLLREICTRLFGAAAQPLTFSEWFKRRTRHEN